jgi:hypothetical protein
MKQAESKISKDLLATWLGLFFNPEDGGDIFL